MERKNFNLVVNELKRIAGIVEPSSWFSETCFRVYYERMRPYRDQQQKLFIRHLLSLKPQEKIKIPELKNLNDAKPDMREMDSVLSDKEGDYSTETKNVDVYFRNIEKTIVEKIRGADAVFGCMAWLTNENILNALARKEACSFVCQEEDFLRPDANFIGGTKKWKNKIHRLYSRINGTYGGWRLGGININTEIDCGIRRFGYLNRQKVPAFPRMHNKFIVLCREGEHTDAYDGLFEPYEVITGSYNYSENSNNSLENICCIRDKSIVQAYMNNFKDIFVMSAPLDWDHDWSPNESGDMRYGT